MDIVELKNLIETKKIDDQFMVFVTNDDSSRYVARQYIHCIAELHNLNVKMIDDISNIPDESFIEDTNLYVIETRKWTSDKTHRNCIVIASEGPGVTFPSLVDWQVTDFLSPHLKGLSDTDLSWIMSLYQRNYLRLFNDMSMLECFDETEQKDVFLEMLQEGMFESLSSRSVFDLSNGLFDRNHQEIIKTLQVKDYIDCDPLPLWTIMYRGFRAILMAKTNRSCKPEDVGMNDKQFYFMQKRVSQYTIEQLKEKLKVLSNIEWMFKFGGLDIDQMIDYIIVKIGE